MEPTPTYTGRNGAAPKKRRKIHNPAKYDAHLVRLAKQYEEEYVIYRNNIPFGEFARFMPLFNKEMHDKLDPKARTNLLYEYFQRINPMEPVNVIDVTKVDANGVLWLDDKLKHPVIYKLPPARPKFEPINSLGTEAVKYACELMANSAKTAGPFDQRAKTYSAALADLLDRANKDSSERQRKEFDAMVDDLRKSVRKADGAVESTGTPDKSGAPPKADNQSLGIDWDS